MMIHTWVLTVFVGLTVASPPPAHKNGYCLCFQGGKSVASLKAGYIDFTDAGFQDIEYELTVSYWRKYSGGETRDFGSTGTNFNLVNAADDTFLAAGIRYSYAWNNEINFPFPLDDQWHFITVIVSHGDVKMYFDGQVLTSVKTIKKSLRQDSSAIHFGMHIFNGITSQAEVKMKSSYFGYLDDLAVYSRALNASEVLALSKKPIDTFEDDLVLYYDFQIPRCSGTVPGTVDCSDSVADVAPNLGSAGRKYDLILGGLNNDNGFGETFVDALANGECTTKLPFIAPVQTISNIPYEQGSGSLGRPWVYFKNSEDLVISFTAGDVLHVASFPSQGYIYEETNSGGHVQLTDHRDIQTRSSIVFKTDAALEQPVVFALALNGNSAPQEIHVWPTRAPFLFSNSQVDVEILEDTDFSMEILEFAGSHSGDELDAVVTQLPKRGTLRVGNASGEIVMEPGTVISSLGLTISYTPEAQGSGSPFDQIKLQYRSRKSNLTSPTLTLNLNVLAINDQPVPLNDAGVLDEDNTEGTTFTLGSFDPDDDSIVMVTELPKRGDLYTIIDSTIGPKIELPYDRFNVGTGILEQYVKDIVKVSSFWGSAPGTGYHALNVVGSPSCNEPGECMGDLRFLGNKSKPIVLNDFVMVNRYHLEPAKNNLMVVGRVVSVNQDLTYNIQVHDLQKLVNDSSPVTFEKCLLNGPSFPEDCNRNDYLELPKEGLVFRNVNKEDLGPMRVGVWCPAKKAFSNTLLTGQTNDQGAYGDQYLFNTSHVELYHSGQEPKYTEYIEVEFETPVFPISVEAGSPRGAGAIVRVLAKDPNDKWQPLFSGLPQRSANMLTIQRGLYHRFSERICRPNFKTNVLRLELDTSTETGIADWNYLDYVKLVGSTEIQRAILLHPSNQVIYIPRKDQFGTDSFKFTTTDCTGNILRQSDPATIDLKILPKPDKPTAAYRPEGVVYVFSKHNSIPRNQSARNIELLGGDVDGEQVKMFITQIPNLGRLLQGSTQKDLAIGSYVETTFDGTVSIGNVTYIPYECPESGFSNSATTFVGEDEFSFQVVDQGGSATEVRVQLEVQCEDLGYNSGVAVACNSMCMVNFALSAGFLCWAFVKRKTFVVTSSQFQFLTLIALGTIVSSSTILTITVSDQDKRADEDGGNPNANFACVMMVWLYVIGFVLTFAPLFAKMYRVSRIFEGAQILLKSRIPNSELYNWVGMFLLGDIIIVLIWTLTDPLTFKRSVVLLEKTHLDPIKSTGTCHSENTTLFVVAIGCYHLILLLGGGYTCYKTYGVNTTFSEAKFVTVAIVSNIQVLMLSAVLLSATETPTMSMFIRSGAIWLNDTSTMCFIFVPKIIYSIYGSSTSGEGSALVKMRSPSSSSKVKPMGHQTESNSQMNLSMTTSC